MPGFVKESMCYTVEIGVPKLHPFGSTCGKPTCRSRFVVTAAHQFEVLGALGHEENPDHDGLHARVEPWRAACTALSAGFGRLRQTRAGGLCGPTDPHEIVRANCQTEQKLLQCNQLSSWRVCGSFVLCGQGPLLCRVIINKSSASLAYEGR